MLIECAPKLRLVHEEGQANGCRSCPVDANRFITGPTNRPTPGKPREIPIPIELEFIPAARTQKSPPSTLNQTFHTFSEKEKRPQFRPKPPRATAQASSPKIMGY